MRRLVKVLLALLVVVAVSQTPFAYRRYQLGRLDATIRQLDASRRATDDAGYDDYRGVLHVHSFLGGHSAGRFEEIVAGARANGLAFVVMSEHPSPHFDTRALTLSGTRDGVLFLPGSETSEDARDRLLTFGGEARQNGSDETKPPDNPAASNNGRLTTDNGQSPLQSQIDRAKAEGRLVFVAHPERFSGWQAVEKFDGMEVYNLHADAAHARPLTLLFDGLWSYRTYPHLLWTRFHEAPTENLRRWDELTTKGRRVVAVAGNDAHANVGISLQRLDGEALFEIRLDPYERSFRVVRTHALLPRGQQLTEETLSAALSAGHAYVAFDVLCDSTGFRLTASNGSQQALMGDEITLGDKNVRLRAATPVASRVVLIRDGQKVGEKEGTAAEWDVAERGVYRVECYLPQLPDPLSRKPWIISNPVYVR
ncbi:MAG TPA: CehA/McbA family metallohydrolase [Pyrinomonadaceae bacterium]|nr:CehA/McbA family metallohydrolase [Pyrinomonadaceae bacterium]